MTKADSPSTIIEQMRRAHLGLPPTDGHDNVQADASPPESEPETLDLDLTALEGNQSFMRLFPRHDSAERRAILFDVQTLRARCKAHWNLASDDRALRDERDFRRDRAKRFPIRKPGRPRGAANFAARQFGLGLAMIWWENTGRPPSRYEGHGTYAEFVDLIASAVPRRVRRNPGAELPSIEYLVRESVRDFRLARASNEEYRRRGLLDERTWLHGQDTDEGGV
jgi:hypothetical protein